MSARLIGARFVGSDHRVSEQNRAHLNAAGTFAINLIAAPGAGKSALVRRTVAALGKAARVGVVATRGHAHDGDLRLTTYVDPEPAHLTPASLARALSRSDLGTLDFLIVKNVADFVCPATYQLGTHVNVRLTTVLECDTRPREQPQLFEGLDALVVNKVDRLADGLFDLARFRRGLDELNPNLCVLALSCASGEGVDAWVDWLMRRRTMQFYRSRSERDPRRLGA